MNPLKPVRFYGAALPRPRYHGDGSKERTDPPGSVNDSLLRWAADANWSMGGLSFKRQRMQGKIEGRLKNLKDEPEDDQAMSKKVSRKPKASPEMVLKTATSKSRQDVGEKASKRKETPGRVRGRDGRGPSESQLIVGKRTASVHPADDEWGEEDGPSPFKTPIHPAVDQRREEGPSLPRISPRLNAANSSKHRTPARASTDKHVNQSPARVYSIKQIPRAPTRAMVSNVSASEEFPIVRRRVKSVMPEAGESVKPIELASQSPAHAVVSNVSASVEFPIRRRRVERVLPEADDSDSDANWEEFSRTQHPLRRSLRATSARRNLKDFVSSESEED